MSGALEMDLARLTIKSATVADAHHIYAAAAAAMDVTSVKDRLNKSTRDVLLTVRLSRGLIAEIQIHQERVLALKALTHAHAPRGGPPACRQESAAGRPCQLRRVARGHAGAGEDATPGLVPKLRIPPAATLSPCAATPQRHSHAAVAL